MIYLIELVATSPYALIVALLLLGVVVILQMRRMRSSKRTIITQARKINDLQRQVAALTAQVEAEQAKAQSEMSAEGVVDGSERRCGIAEGALQHSENQGITNTPLASDAKVTGNDDVTNIEKGVSVADHASQTATTERLSGSDEDLLKRFIAQIDANMSDINLSIDDISSDMCMSRSNLFRKIKQITGVGPNEYIRLARLKRAAELLAEGRHSIADICMLVGFNSPSYFSSCFKKQYGCLPKDYK